MYKYFPHTEADISEMLGKIGLSSLDELYAEIPENIRFDKDYDLKKSMSEDEVRNYFRELGKTNKKLIPFAGGRRLRSLCPCGYRPTHLPFGIPHGLYSLSARNFSGNTTIYIRVSKHDMRADRYGMLQCFHVRRSYGRGRSHAHVDCPCQETQ